MAEPRYEFLLGTKVSSRRGPKSRQWQGLANGPVRWQWASIRFLRTPENWDRPVRYCGEASAFSSPGNEARRLSLFSQLPDHQPPVEF